MPSFASPAFAFTLVTAFAAQAVAQTPPSAPATTVAPPAAATSVAPPDAPSAAPSAASSPSTPPVTLPAPPPQEPAISPNTGGSPVPPESAPVVVTPSASPLEQTRTAGVRELRVTPTSKGGPGDPASVAAGPGGFGLSSPDKKWQIRFRALVQTDGRFWFDDDQRAQTSTFLIRRAYPIIEGKLPYGVSFLLYPDFGGGSTSLQDAYVGIDISDALRLRIGKYRPPFGLERLQPTSNLSFVEFGLPTLLAPNRDVGVMVHGDLFKGLFGYAAGVFNGVPDNGSADIDTDNQKEFAGRVYFRPLLPIPGEALGRLFVGVATTFGRDYGTPSSTSLTNPQSTPSYKTPGQSTDFSYISAPSGTTPTYVNTVVANGPHNRYGVYFYEALGPFSLLGEYYLSNQEVGRSGFPNVVVHNRAYQAQATYVLFGAQASYDFVHVQTPVDPSAGHFGALELAARAGHLDIDSDVFPNYASKSASVSGATEVTLGVNWYWSDNLKLVANWDHTEFQGGASTAAEIAAGHREAENIVLLRAQVVY